MEDVFEFGKYLFSLFGRNCSTVYTSMAKAPYCKVRVALERKKICGC